jgi:hypothetical protein
MRRVTTKIRASPTSRSRSVALTCTMSNFFNGATAIFSKKVDPEILVDWRTFPLPPLLCLIHLTKDYYGGKLFYEVNRGKNDVPDYYFTKKSHTNFYHPYVRISWKSLSSSEGVMVLSTDWILDSVDAQALLPCRYYTVTGVPPCPPTWSIDLM